MKIAVCISGLIRYWNETYPLFEYWNTLYQNKVEFVFFLSTWIGPKWYEKERFGELDLKDHDYSNYKFITDFSLHTEAEVNFPEHMKLPNSFLRAYAMKQVQTLRKNYEDKNDMLFDSILQIRNDMFINKDILDKCVRICIKQPYYLQHKVVMTPGGTNIRGSDLQHLAVDDDNFIFSNSKSMNIIMNLFDSLPTQRYHSCHHGEAEFYFKNGITNLSLDIAPVLFREGRLRKNGRPTPQSMRELLDTKGVKWIYEQNFGILQDTYWKLEL